MRAVERRGRDTSKKHSATRQEMPWRWARGRGGGDGDACGETKRKKEWGLRLEEAASGRGAKRRGPEELGFP